MTAPTPRPAARTQWCDSDGSPMMLVRYRPGVVGETRRTVHLVPLPAGGQAGVAMCGAVLRPELVEIVVPGHGAPCVPCLVRHLSADPS